MKPNLPVLEVMDDLIAVHMRLFFSNSVVGCWYYLFAVFGVFNGLCILFVAPCLFLFLFCITFSMGRTFLFACNLKRTIIYHFSFSLGFCFVACALA